MTCWSHRPLGLSAQWRQLHLRNQDDAEHAFDTSAHPSAAKIASSLIRPSGLLFLQQSRKQNHFHLITHIVKSHVPNQDAKQTVPKKNNLYLKTKSSHFPKNGKMAHKTEQWLLWLVHIPHWFDKKLKFSLQTIHSSFWRCSWLLK